MGPVYELNGLRVIDRSKPLDPETESRRCRLIRYNTGGPIPDYHTALDLTSHLGTHCECPYHHFEDGKSVEILEGVTANDTVILTGKLTLSDGQPVNATEGK